jgi:pimeloyl-ACP methyl ester carboxylesterase
MDHIQSHSLLRRLWWLAFIPAGLLASHGLPQPLNTDINSDSVPDTLIVEPAFDPNPIFPGWIGIESGSSTDLLWYAQGETPYDYFAYATEWINDLDGDGIADIIVGAPLSWETDRLGRAEVYSGATGTLLFAMHGQPGDTFGVGVGGVADFNQDGIHDLVVVAHFHDQFRNIFEIEYIFSGLDGSPLWVQPDAEGVLVRIASDVDGGGQVDPGDVILVVEDVGASVEPGSLNPADVNGDGYVDGSDVAAVVDDQGLTVGDAQISPVLPRLSMWPVLALEPPPAFGSTSATSGSSGGVGGGGTGDDTSWSPPQINPDPGSGWIDGEDDNEDGGDDWTGSRGEDGSDESDDGSGPNSCGVSVGLSPILHWLPFTGYPEPYERNFEARGSPSGGSYSWSVTGASYKVIPTIRTDISVIRVKITKPGRVTVKVTYTYDGCKRSRTVRFFAFHADIDVDSDNNDGLVDVEGSTEEEIIEDDTQAGPGKVLFTSQFDSDGDGVPDFADGMGRGWGTPEPGDIRFTPVELLIGKLPSGTDYTVEFLYDASDPQEMTGYLHANTGPADGSLPQYHFTLPSHRKLRLWKKNGSEIRNPSSNLAEDGDFVASGVEYDPYDLGMTSSGRATLWLEAVQRSGVPAQDRIRMILRIQGDPPQEIPASITHDAVRVTAAKLHVNSLFTWDPTLIDFGNQATSGLRLLNTDFSDLSNWSNVQGAITDGVSGVLVHFEPPVGEYLQDAELRIVKKGENFTDYPRAVGGFSDVQEFLPPLPYSPTTGGLSGSISAAQSMAFYFPPEAYLDPEYPQGSPVTLNSDEMCDMAFEVATDQGVIGKLNFVLRRPPVLLVHGLNSSSTAWEPSIWRNSIQPPGLPTQVYTLDYEATNDRGYDDNVLRIPWRVQQILDEYRSGHLDGRRYAASRLDYVGHSMGGVLGRIYISDANTHQQGGLGLPRKEGHWPIRITRPTWDDQYLRQNNWFAGDFRRFISIGSPFRGSLWAVDAETALKALYWANGSECCFVVPEQSSPGYSQCITESCCPTRGTGLQHPSP